MTLKIESYSAMPCHLKAFEINGIEACEEDFGESIDAAPENAPDYSCGCRKFTANYNISDNILDKYKITKEEYLEICEKLQEELYVGCCAGCA